MANEFKIGNKSIGENHPTFIIAEISGNHNQNYENAAKLVKAACEAGVDAVKIQTYTPDTMTIDSNKHWFRVNTDNEWNGKYLYDLYKIAYTPWEWQPKLAEIAKSYGVPLFSTPFDESAVDFLEKMDVPAYKIASFELTDHELLKKVASTKKPVIISRGISSLEELEESINILKTHGCPEVAVLHCVSAYPALPEEMNLATISDLKKKFNTSIGLSDHTLSTETSIAAISLGAKIIEKHITFNRKEKFIDSSFSLEPQEFKELIRQIRNVEKAIGHPNYNVGKREHENYVLRRSLFVVEDVKAGQEFTRENIRCIRPGYGLAPKFISRVLGRKAKQDIEKGTPLNWELINQT